MHLTYLYKAYYLFFLKSNIKQKRFLTTKLHLIVKEKFIYLPGT